MYYIVGSDNQTHGPINADTLNQWIAQGRANGQTMTRLDDSQEWKPLATFSEFAPALAHAPSSSSAASQSDSTGGVIPYKNVPALVGYYMSVFGLASILLPAIGVLWSIPTVVLGVKGLKKVKANPQLRGTAHAWVAIVLGGFTTIFHVVIIVIIIVGIVKSQ